MGTDGCGSPPHPGPPNAGTGTRSTRPGGGEGMRVAGMGLRMATPSQVGSPLYSGVES